MKSFRRAVASLLVACIGLAGLPIPAFAGMLSTEAALPGARERVASLLAREEVQERLASLGVSRSEVATRVAAMTDEEAALLVARIDSLPSGGADLLGVLLTVFIVLLITDILGFTKVFPFTRAACDRGRC